MDIEDLNKHQLLLLTILVSFVTSIATGIVTVSLLQQAPSGITTTINQVVERTVEKVVPGDSKTVVKEVPVIVTEEALIVKAIDGSKNSVVKIMEVGNILTSNVASGFMVNPRGRIVSAMHSGFSPSGRFQLVTGTGGVYPLEIVTTDDVSKLVVYKVKDEKLEAFNKETGGITPLKISGKDVIVGQTAIGISGGSQQGHSVAVSIISSSMSAAATSTQLRTNAATPDNLGGPLLDIHGEVIGVAVTSGVGVDKSLVQLLLDSVK